MNEPPCAPSVSFHFIEGSEYENSVFSPVPQVTNSDFKIKKIKKKKKGKLKQA
jgi:hypothetical protein